MIQDIGIVDMQGDELDQQSQLSTNEECDNTHIEEEIEFEIKEAVKKPSNQQIDFPLISKFKRPLKVLLPIPSNYQFDDISQYKETMLRLEDENYFQTFRNSLKYHISKKFEDSQTSHDGFYVVSNFSVASFSYQQTGLILDVKTIVRIPRYQKQKAEMMNNQIIIFVNVDTQKIFVGKTIVEKNSNQFEDKYKISEDNQVCKDQEVEQVDQFENIGFSQSFQIIMDTQNYLIIQFLINLNDDQSKFKLVIPSDYWHSLEKSLNCQLQFQKLNEIAFPGQTLKAEKGSSSFPKYSFLESDNEKVEQFKSMLENEIQKEKQLDESQKVALRHALFNENAIIQGPPGTGKTFLASKIVNILKNVHNKLTRKPIIVISLKNISLDQLLVKITNQNKSIKILRLGYGITDQRVKKCILNNGNFIDAPKIQYPQSSKEAVDSIDKNMNECIENIKKRKDQLRFQQKKEIQLPKNLENSIKKKLIELLRNQLSFLNEDQDLEEEIQDKIFQKWMKGKLSIQKLEKYLSQAGIYLTGEDQEYLSRSIDIQKTDQELNLYPSERSIMKFLKNITSLEQLSLSFSKFLIDNQDTIEIDIIQNQMNNYSHSRSSALMEYNSNYQDELSTFMEDFDVIDLSQQQFSLGSIGVEAQYENLEIKALDQEQFLLRGQEKSPKICGICKGKSHIINCSAPKQLNTAFQHMQLNDQNVSQYKKIDHLYKNQIKMIQDIGIVDMQGDELDLQSQLSTNEECDNTHIEKEIEFEIKEAVKKPSNQQIDFPLISKLKRPLKALLPIPSNYQFDDISQYKETMFRLEDENYFQTFRNSLKYHISQKFEDSQTNRDGFYVISNFSVGSFSFQQEGLLLNVNTLVRIPRYQQKKAEMMSNQVIIFVSVDTQKIFVGKTIVETNSNLLEDGDDENIYEDEISEDNKQYEDEEVEQEDQFEKIEFSQSFQIRMDTLNNLDEFLINLNDNQSKFKLVIPSDYWHSLEKSLNCQLQFQKLDKIAFPGQTLKAEKGFSNFPKYSFLQSDNEVEYFKSMLENEIYKENQLDESQKVALRHVLFNENAIVQGPPGTGKTFLASKIVSILKNVHNNLTRKPIIVISLKNISLDQLLVKITNQSKFIKILRLGYRVTDKRVKKFTLNNENFQDAPKFQYPKYSKEAVDSIDKHMKECIENIKKRKDQSRFQQEKETQFPKNLENSIKKKLIELLRNQLSFLNEDQDLEEEIQDKIFQKWMKGKLSFQKLEKYLTQAGVYLTGEDKEYLSRRIGIQQTDQELNLYPSERSIMKFLKNITSLEQLSISFSKFLIDNQDTIEIDIIQNQMNNYSHSRSSALMRCNSNYQDELSTFMEDFDVIDLSQQQFSLGAIGVEAQYKNLEIKALDQEQFLLRGQEKTPKICGICKGMSHIINCSAPKQLNTAFQHMQLNDQNASQVYQQSKKYQKTKNYQKQFYK
ncbi:hypothetical protein ABPG73_020397 [Tetrahymena malaccensis]